jgi:hypothetical protein
MNGNGSGGSRHLFALHHGWQWSVAAHLNHQPAAAGASMSLLLLLLPPSLLHLSSPHARCCQQQASGLTEATAVAMCLLLPKDSAVLRCVA